MPDSRQLSDQGVAPRREGDVLILPPGGVETVVAENERLRALLEKAYDALNRAAYVGDPGGTEMCDAVMAQIRDLRGGQ